MTWSP